MGSIISKLKDLIRGVKSVIGLLLALSAEYNEALKRAAESPGRPNPNLSESYWLVDPPYPELVNIQSLELPQTADVAIIGSGIAGASIARSLMHERRRRNVDTQKVIVLEARQLSSGATARNGGHIKPVPYESFAKFSKTMSKERAAALVRFQLRHLEILTDLCRAEGIQAAEAREVETVDFYLDEESFLKSVEEVDAMKEWIPEVDVRTWDGPKARQKFGVNDGVMGAISYKAGAIWPYRFVASIWKDLLHDFPKSLTIETNTPVESISVSQNGQPGYPYAVQTTRGVIHVRHVVHATNGFASHLVPGLRKKIVGAKAHMSAQKPGDKMPCSNGNRSWGVIYGGNFDYVTQRPSTPGEPAGDVMLGGGFMRSLKQGVDQLGLYDDSGRLDPLTVTHIAGIFPAIFHPNWGPGSELKQTWSGILGLTGDLIPLVGRLDKQLTGRDVGNHGSGTDGSARGQEWVAAGFSGEGMIWAWLCGVALGTMLAGSEEEDVPQSPGRPGGKLKEWFPNEIYVSPERLQSADVSHLADQM